MCEVIPMFTCLDCARLCTGAHAVRSQGVQVPCAYLMGTGRCCRPYRVAGASPCGWGGCSKSGLTSVLLSSWPATEFIPPALLPLSKECAASCAPESSDNVLYKATALAGTSRAVYPLWCKLSLFCIVWNLLWDENHSLNASSCLLVPLGGCKLFPLFVSCGFCSRECSRMRFEAEDFKICCMISALKKKETNCFFCSVLTWFCCCSNIQRDFNAWWELMGISA